MLEILEKHENRTNMWQSLDAKKKVEAKIVQNFGGGAWEAASC